MTESSRARRVGQSLTADNQRVMGGFGVVSGISTILVIGAGLAIGLAVGLFFGILALLLGVWLVTLVAPSVQMWIDRSLVGHHSSQVLPFEDLASEQSSLEMVFQGVVVEMSWESIPVNRTTNPIPKRRIMLKVALPQAESMELRLVLSTLESLNQIFNWRYEKAESNEGLIPATNGGQESRSASGERATPLGALGNEKPNGLEQPDFNSQGELYVMEWETEVFRDEFGRGISLSVFYLSNTLALTRKRTDFKVEF